MPYPNEHAARLTSPDKFVRFRRGQDQMGEGIDVIFGITQDGKSEIQSIRLDSSKFTETQAMNWLKENKFEPIKFEPATGKGEDTMAEEIVVEEPKKEEEMGKHEEEKVMEKDVFETVEEAEVRAQELGGEGHHELEVEDKVMYMPLGTHDEYLEAIKKEMGEDKEEKEMGAHDKDKEKDMGEDKEKEKKMAKVEDCDCDAKKDVCDCRENTAENYALEQTFNINGIEIFSTGVWNGDKYTAKDLDAMVSNFEKTGFQPPLKLGHNEEQPEMKDGEPALGYVDKIYKNGNKLLADFKELPKKVYEAMKRGNYKRVSSEIYWNYKNNGSVLDRVLKAVALLGSEIPAVTNLEAIEGLYSQDTGTGEVKKHYTEKESELMEKDITKEYQELEAKVKALEEANEKAYSELEETRKSQRAERISKFISDNKEAGKVLPTFEKELEALLSSATEAKVYSYTLEENTVELSQLELVEKIVSSFPKLVEFAEVSSEGDFIVDRQPYENAGNEVDRRAKLYMNKGKAKDYQEAISLVFKEDEQLKTDYFKQQ